MNKSSYHPNAWPALGPKRSMKSPMGNFEQQRQATAMLKTRLNRLLCKEQVATTLELPDDVLFRIAKELSVVLWIVDLSWSLLHRYLKNPSASKTETIEAHPYVIPDRSSTSITATMKNTTWKSNLFVCLYKTMVRGDYASFPCIPMPSSVRNRETKVIQSEKGSTKGNLTSDCQHAVSQPWLVVLPGGEQSNVVP